MSNYKVNKIQYPRDNEVERKIEEELNYEFDEEGYQLITVIPKIYQSDTEHLLFVYEKVELDYTYIEYYDAKSKEKIYSYCTSDVSALNLVMKNGQLFELDIKGESIKGYYNYSVYKLKVDNEINDTIQIYLSLSK